MERYYYSDNISGFVNTSTDTILGQLSRNNDFTLEQTQRNSWLSEIDALKVVLSPYRNRGAVFFEYNIPRMGRRIDVVVLIDGIIFLLEYKVGEEKYLASDIEQVWDYALDLKNFHEQSHYLPIIPILIATDAPNVSGYLFEPFDDNVYKPMICNQDTLSSLIRSALAIITHSEIDTYMWGISRYAPTPTIIEAALSLYNSHSVKEITRHDASAENLSVTSQYIMQVIEKSKKCRQKSICFVTGVPGAGKTLVGLNIATQQSGEQHEAPAVYLSGNGPLVKVLCEALTRDKLKRDKADGVKVTKKEVESKIKAFIQNVHNYRDACLEGTMILNDEIVPDEKYFRTPENLHKSYAPIDHVAIFDEAQRAWTKEMTAKFMSQKKNKPNFPYSEPEYLISCLDRHNDWAVIVCLVGGGQEINTGEAGISEWIEALNRNYQDWHIYISDKLTDSEYVNGDALEMLKQHSYVTIKTELHLAVSMRSFRAEKLSDFVHALLDLNSAKASALYKELNRYPIVLTRNLDKAKQWLKGRSRGSERYGMVVSSMAYRLKPLAIDVRVQPDTVCWFLNGREDIRSSFFLEDVATEFDIQGLELDWICLVWDGDLRYSANGWQTYSYVGTKWNRIIKEERQKYLVNAYRVLLTRARQGMVIVVPEGNDDDHTRKKEYYDSTFEYLKGIGMDLI